MIGKIIEINNNTAIIELTIDITKQPNLVGLHIVFEDNQKKIVGEIEYVSKTTMKANIIGELNQKDFIPGTALKPSFKSNIRMIALEELTSILGEQKLSKNEVSLGVSNVYENYPININIKDRKSVV